METNFLHWLEFMFLPPGFILILLLAGLITSLQYRKVGFCIGLSSFILLWVLSLPIVARNLLSSLQEFPALIPSEIEIKESDSIIVILGAGRYSKAPEYGLRDEISPITLERLRYGAYLADKLTLPILLSGGRRDSNATSEAVMMNQVMVNVFNMNPQYLEINGANTHQQAVQVKKMLTDKSLNKIYLVTNAWHMKRANAEFSALGLHVIPASMGYAATSKAKYDYLPSASALSSTSRALHEYYALLYLDLMN